MNNYSFHPCVLRYSAATRERSFVLGIQTHSCNSLISYCASIVFTHRSRGARYPLLYNDPFCMTKHDALILTFVACLSSHGSIPSKKYSIIGRLHLFPRSTTDIGCASLIDFVFTISIKTCFAKCKKTDNTS